MFWRPGFTFMRLFVVLELDCMRPESSVIERFCLFSSVALDELINRSEIQDPCTLIARYKLMQTNGPL